MRRIAVDAARVAKKHDKTFRVCVGSGHAYLGLRADWQAQLARAHRECGFEFVRFHGLFCDDMGVYLVDADGKVSYNWQRVDKLYDAILAAGVRPFVELGFMPSALASGEKTVFWWKANVTPPKDMARWEEMIREFTQHMTDRHGREEVASWLFEVWNEGDHPAFFSAGMKEYFEMYAAAARAVKSVCKDYRIGGPATACAIWIPELIDFCCDNKLGLDFITYHAYGLTSGHFDEFGTENFMLDPNPDAILHVFRKVKEEIAASKMPKLPIHVTEWSASYSSRDSLHDSYVSAPYILHKLKRMEGLADSKSYWTFSDIFEEVGPEPNAFYGGFGLVNCQGLAKPAYHAYRYLNMLGEDELAGGDADSWACRSEQGVQVLLWDYTCPTQDAPNREFYDRDLPAGPAEPATVTVRGLASGEYELTTYKVGYEVNDVLADYRRMGSPNSPTPAQVAALAAANDGGPVERRRVRIDADQGVFEQAVPLRQNDIVLLTLTRLA